MSTVRITGGSFRGRKVVLPRQHELRPTSDRARQAFFNIVGAQIAGANFLDLFAGTGIFAFEALSRGAASATAIEIARKAAFQIKETAELLNTRVNVIHDDVLKGLRRLSTASESFDVVFADPPYDYDHYDALLQSLDEETPLSAGALVAIEHRSDAKPFRIVPASLVERRTAVYGSVAITIFDKEDAA